MKRGIVVSDPHVGSIYGLLPPGFIDSNGVEVHLNIGQQYLWECWQDFWRRVGEHCHFENDYSGLDFIIINGDVVDGKQQAQRGTELALPLIADQKRAAVEVLSKMNVVTSISPMPRIFFVQGTTYHVGDAAEWEEQIAEMLGAEQYYSIGTGRYCREVLWLDVEGVIIEAAHHISTVQGFYRATGLDREMQWSAMAGKDASKGVPKADLIIRSHVHFFISLEHESKQGVITPCWQLQTKFMRKNSVHRMLPSIGGLVLEVDGEAKKMGRAPVRIIKETYSLPSVPITKL